MKSLSLLSPSVIHRELRVLTNSEAIILTTTLYILWLDSDLGLDLVLHLEQGLQDMQDGLLSLCNSPD